MIITPVKYTLHYPSIATLRTTVPYFIPQPPLLHFKIAISLFLCLLHCVCLFRSLFLTLSTVFFFASSPLLFFFLICDIVVPCKDPTATNISFTAVNMNTTRWRSWLRHFATSRKIAGSIPGSATWIFHWHNPSRPHYDPGVDPANNRNECQEYFLEGGGVKAAGA